jgi:hypothetical protein
LLHAERPRIDRKAEREIVDRISAQRVRRAGGFRLALAGVMTAVVFGAMAAFGGVSYATNSVYHSVGGGNSNTGWNYKPSCDQYGHKGDKGDKGGYGFPGYPGKNKGPFGGFFGGFFW